MNPETATTETNLPQHLVLGNVTYNANDNPELKAFIDAIAKTVTQREKTKVYSQIEALKSQLAELNKVVPVVNQPTTQAPVIDQGKLIEDIATKLTGNFQTMLDAAINPLKQKSDLAEKASLADYRLKLITENQLNCIPELVVGNTKAELDAALKSSQELRSKYGTTGLTQIPAQPEVPSGQMVTTPPVTPVVTAPAVVVPTQVATPPVVTPPGRTDTVPVGTPDVKNMSMTEFAKKREELQASLAALTQQ